MCSGKERIVTAFNAVKEIMKKVELESFAAHVERTFSMWSFQKTEYELQQVEMESGTHPRVRYEFLIKFVNRQANSIQNATYNYTGTIRCSDWYGPVLSAPA